MAQLANRLGRVEHDLYGKVTEDTIVSDDDDDNGDSTELKDLKHKSTNMGQKMVNAELQQPLLELPSNQ